MYNEIDNYIFHANFDVPQSSIKILLFFILNYSSEMDAIDS